MGVWLITSALAHWTAGSVIEGLRAKASPFRALHVTWPVHANPLQSPQMPVVALYDVRMPPRGTASSVPCSRPTAAREGAPGSAGSGAALASLSRLSSFTPIFTRWPCGCIKHACSFLWVPPLCSRCQGAPSTVRHCLQGQSPADPQRSLAWYPSGHESRKSTRLQCQPQSPPCRRAQKPGLTCVVLMLYTHLRPPRAASPAHARKPF